MKKNSEYIGSFAFLNGAQWTTFRQVLFYSKYLQMHFSTSKSLYVFRCVTLHIGMVYLICGLLNECIAICFWCLRIYPLIFFNCHFVWKLFPSKKCSTLEFCFCSSVQKNTQYVLVFDAFVILICLASLILCTRSIVLALSLRKVSICLNFFPSLLASALNLSKQWMLMLSHPALPGAFN